MKKMIKYSTPRYIQEDVAFKKHQYEEVIKPVARRKRYCIKTKGEHVYSEVTPRKYDWWYKWWTEGGIKEYRCLCGKKKTDITKSIFSP